MKENYIYTVYSIKNLINGKEYIGVSHNIVQRWYQHQSAARHYEKFGNPMYKDMYELGIQNFIFQILEENIKPEDKDEREKFWIQERNTLIPNGYNISIGGDGGNGVDRYSSAIRSQELLEEIQTAIRDTNLSFKKLAEKYCVTETVICGINLGQYYKTEGLNYPLRLSRYDKELVKRIISSLKYETHKTLRQIAEEYDVDLSQVEGINYGDIYHEDWLEYPLRSGKVASSCIADAPKIIDLLLNSDIPQKDIAKRFNVSPSIVTAINKGRSFKDESLTYPLRVNYQEGPNKRKSFSPNEIKEIEDYLENTDLSMRKIAAIYDAPLTLIQNMNNGAVKKYRNPKKDYPLRKRKSKRK